MFNNKDILITGGTGSFGRQCIKTILERFRPNRLIVYSRDEYKQFEMQKLFDQSPMRYFLGDVRDVDRLKQAMHRVNFVIHAAALKQVPAAEYNPMEFVKTNVSGAGYVIKAESSHITLEFADHFVIKPTINYVSPVDYSVNLLDERGVPVAEGFEYSSATNPHFLAVSELQKLNELCL